MNPAKRKKLFRLELQKKHLLPNQITHSKVETKVEEKVETKVEEKVETKVEEKVIQKEETVEQTVIAESTSYVTDNVEMGLKLSNTDAVETKKEKKKKWSSQDV